MAQAAVTLLFGTEAAARVPNLGASGAIAAVLGAFIVLYPAARIRTLVLIFFVKIPARVYLGGWFVYQLVEGQLGLTSASSNGGGIALFAHIDGFAFGAFVTLTGSSRATSSTPTSGAPPGCRSSRFSRSPSWECCSADWRLSSRSRSPRRLRRSSTSVLGHQPPTEQPRRSFRLRRSG
jgi:hypothetical protein